MKNIFWFAFTAHQVKTIQICLNIDIRPSKIKQQLLYCLIVTEDFNTRDSNEGQIIWQIPQFATLILSQQQQDLNKLLKTLNPTFWNLSRWTNLTPKWNFTKYFFLNYILKKKKIKFGYCQPPWITDNLKKSLKK